MLRTKASHELRWRGKKEQLAWHRLIRLVSAAREVSLSAPSRRSSAGRSSSASLMSLSRPSTEAVRPSTSPTAASLTCRKCMQVQCTRL